MQFTGQTLDSEIDQHRGHVAGRYRNGALSDEWTDVTRCAEATFTAYVPVCSCGWRGRRKQADAAGAELCRREWTYEHLMRVLPTRHSTAALR